MYGNYTIHGSYGLGFHETILGFGGRQDPKKPRYQSGGQKSKPTHPSSGSKSRLHFCHWKGKEPPLNHHLEDMFLFLHIFC